MRVQRVGAGLVAVAGLLVAGLAGGGGTDTPHTPPTRDVAVQAADQAPVTDPPPPDPEPTAPGPDEAPLPLDGRVVVVDPSHNSGQVGAEDEIAEPVEIGGVVRACNSIGGATADGVLEAAINWEIAQVLAAKLRTLGAEVVLTREDDDSVGPCIDERVALATEVAADLVLNIHADAWDEGDRGFHVAHAVGDATVADPDVLAEARRSAQVVRDHLVAARFLPSELAGSEGVAPRDDLTSLNAATVPTVLVAAGNLLDPGDAELLTSAAGQQRLASALAAAVVAVATDPAV